MRILFVFLSVCISIRGYTIDYGLKEITQYYPFLEWTVADVSYEGNPFDLVASVTYEHASSTETHMTEMFYVGNGTWKFRFSGTSIGKWRFSTQSANTGLDGHKGEIEVIPNPDEDAVGFIRPLPSDPTKWSRQKGASQQYVPFLPHFVMYDEAEDIEADKIETDIQTLLIEHGFTGFHIPVKEPDIWIKDEVPNLQLFEELEQIISEVHKAGFATHIWLWGDKSRKQYPIWGINGEVDQRLQRYIAARLGPLPSWTLSYGFDLWEWVDGKQLDEWYAFMEAHFGWEHLMGARSQKNAFTQLTEKMDYASYELHKDDNWYEQWVRVVRERPDKPAFSEDRFRVRGKYAKDVSEQETRRGLYYSVLAGGAAAIWGNLRKPAGKGYVSSGKSFPYEHPEWIKCWSTFFHTKQRFLPDMQAANDLSDGYVLHSSSTATYIAYKENTAELSLQVSVKGSVPVIGINTQTAYEEITLGNVESGQHTFSFPTESDWIVAVGTFPEVTDAPPIDPPAPTPTQGVKLEQIFLEGFYDRGQQKMLSVLKEADFFPLAHPFNSSPWNYQGTEKLGPEIEGVVDWVLVCLRDLAGDVIEKQACVLTETGEVRTVTGEDVLVFDAFRSEEPGDERAVYIVSLHHKSHLAIGFEVHVGKRISPLEGDVPIGNEQLKIAEGVPVMYCGDFDGNQIINNLDYNLWKLNSAALGQYVAIDADGNGIVNNQDANLWAVNRSKIGVGVFTGF